MFYCHCINWSVYGARKRGSLNNARKGSMTEVLGTLGTSFLDPSRPDDDRIVSHDAPRFMFITAYVTYHDHYSTTRA